MISAPKVSIATVPTEIQRLDALSPGQGGGPLWIKRDDQTSPMYGGNKVRKLEYILGDARAAGKKALVTVGVCGSHHVLATGLFGKDAGFDVTAVLMDQPATDEARRNLRVIAGLGMRLVAAPTRTKLAFALMQERKAASYFVQGGGSSLPGTLGYVEAARELHAQVRAGIMPEPDEVVITLGTGGSAAGLAAGFELLGMKTRVVAVAVVPPPWVFARAARGLARRAFDACGGGRGDGTDSAKKGDWLAKRLVIEKRYLGDGYARPTEEGRLAIAIAGERGLALEPTYTGKTFAAALSRVKDAEGPVVLYWHTLSGAMGERLTALAVADAELRADLEELLR